MKTLLLLVLFTVSECDKFVRWTGQSVTLPCKYDTNSTKHVEVCWGRGWIPNSGCNNQLIDTDGHRVTFRASDRFQLLGRLDEGDVSLTILNLTEEDTGRYGCRVEIPGLFNDEKHHFDLTVNLNPDLTTSPPSQTETQNETQTETPSSNQTSGLTIASTPNSSADSPEQPKKEQSLLVFLVVVLFVVVVLLTAAGVFIKTKGWKLLKLPMQHQVQPSTISATVQLSHRGPAMENIYGIDEDDYEFCP